MEKIFCPYCGEELVDDPFDNEDEIDIEQGRVHMESHYDCPHCEHWFTVSITADLANLKMNYRKRG